MTAGDQEATVPRFGRGERLLHWSVAAVFGVLFVTGAVLYLPVVSAAVGRRQLARDLHVLAGLGLPLPLLVARVGPGRAGLAADLRRLARWDVDDERWFRSRGRDRSVRLGKFNPGQKLFATFVAAAGVLMLVTGAVMRWFEPFPLAWRTGATFVHDWLALLSAAAVAGHVGLALTHGEALMGMVRGRVPAAWARRHRPRWHAELAAAARELAPDHHSSSPGPMWAGRDPE